MTTLETLKRLAPLFKWSHHRSGWFEGSGPAEVFIEVKESGVSAFCGSAPLFAVTVEQLITKLLITLVARGVSVFPAAPTVELVNAGYEWWWYRGSPKGILEYQGYCCSFDYTLSVQETNPGDWSGPCLSVPHKP